MTSGKALIDIIYFAAIVIYKYCKIEWINCIIAVSISQATAQTQRTTMRHYGRMIVLTFLLCACSAAANSGAVMRPVMSANVIRIMPLGDSITAGLGSSSSAGFRVKLWRGGPAGAWEFKLV